MPTDRQTDITKLQVHFCHVINAHRNDQLCFKIRLRIVVFFFSFLFVRIRPKVFRFLNSFSQKPELKQAILGSFNYSPYASHFIHLPSTLLSLNTERISNTNHETWFLKLWSACYYLYANYCLLVEGLTEKINKFKKMKHKPRISEYGALLATLGHKTHPCCLLLFPIFAFLFKSKANTGGTIKLLNLI